MSTTRGCEQCGTRFVPRREHSRFCCAPCRVAWNSVHERHAVVSSVALDWSLTAMSEAIARLARSRPIGSPTAEAHAAVAVSEAVWWVTIVDATMVRYHPDTYDATIDALRPAQREEIEQTLAGLRFVRNQMGVHLDPTEFIDGRGTALTWSDLTPVADEELSASGQEWERSRYLAYARQLAGHDVTRAFTLAGRFLRQAASAVADGEAGSSPIAADG